MTQNSLFLNTALFLILFILSPNLCTSRPLSQETISSTNKDFLIIRMKGSNDLAEDTCRSTPNYQLCISTVQSDPRSINADIAGLGLVIVDAVKQKAVAAVEIINQLKKSKPEYGLPLLECSILYNAILKADVAEAVEGLRKGVPKFAENGMDDAALEVRGCEESFRHANVVSPLDEMNQTVYELSVVAKSIIRLLL